MNHVFRQIFCTKADPRKEPQCHSTEDIPPCLELVLYLFTYFLCALMWGLCARVSEDNLWEAVLCFHVGPGSGAQVVSLGSKCLHELCHLTDPGDFLNAAVVFGANQRKSCMCRQVAQGTTEKSPRRTLSTLWSWGLHGASVTLPSPQSQHMLWLGPFKFNSVTSSMKTRSYQTQLSIFLRFNTKHHMF